MLFYQINDLGSTKFIWNGDLKIIQTKLFHSQLSFQALMFIPSPTLQLLDYSSLGMFLITPLHKLESSPINLVKSSIFIFNHLLLRMLHKKFLNLLIIFHPNFIRYNIQHFQVSQTNTTQSFRCCEIFPTKRMNLSLLISISPNELQCKP